MRVIVTGGAGFIGSHTVDALLAGGHEVAIIDDLSSGFLENVDPRAAFHEADIRDKALVEKIFDDFRPQAVIHFAAQMDVRVSTRMPDVDAQINIGGTINILQSCRAVGVDRVVYSASGGTVYGETAVLPVSEEHSVNPISPYGITKHTVEHYLYLYARNFGVTYASLRYPNVFGPRQNPRGEAGVIAIFARKLLIGEACDIFGDGSQTRDYVYIADVVRANLMALNSTRNLLLNIGSGVGRSVTEVYEAVSRAVGVSIPARHLPEREGEVAAIALDSIKAERELGWKPSVSFGEAVSKTVDSLRILKSEGKLS